MSPHRHITLAIETSNPSRTDDSCAGVGLYEGEHSSELSELACVQLRKGSSHDDALVRAIDSCARTAGIGPSDIRRIAVSVGPGGYTSVRIATTVAKSIALVSGAECVPVPTSLGVIRALSGRVTDSERCLLCLAWKRNESWSQVFRNDEPNGEASIRTVDDIAAFEGELVIADTAFIDRVRESHPDFKTQTVEPSFEPSAVAAVSFACRAVPTHELVPMYPREPEAVRVWAERKAR